MTFPLPNGRLAKLGVSREIKRRALRELERARLITIERPAPEDTDHHPDFALTVYERHIPPVYERHMVCLRRHIRCLFSSCLSFFLFCKPRQWRMGMSSLEVAGQRAVGCL